MEHPENPQRPGTRVLDAVDLVRRQMEAGTGAQRKRVAGDMGDSLSRDDVANLVVGVAVERCLARLDDAHELGDVGAARVLVDEISKAPLDGRFELGLIPEPNRDLTL